MLFGGVARIVSIDLGRKVIIRGGSSSSLLQKWNLDRWYAGRNEHTMGIRGSKMAFLRPPYHGDSERNFRVFEATIPWGKGQDRTAGKQRERDRVRERERERERYPSFQKRDAHALRFGSMNSITSECESRWYGVQKL